MTCNCVLFPFVRAYPGMLKIAALESQNLQGLPYNNFLLINPVGVSEEYA